LKERCLQNFSLELDLSIVEKLKESYNCFLYVIVV